MLLKNKQINGTVEAVLVPPPIVCHGDCLVTYSISFLAWTVYGSLLLKWFNFNPIMDKLSNDQ